MDVPLLWRIRPAIQPTEFGSSQEVPTLDLVLMRQVSLTIKRFMIPLLLSNVRR